MRHARAGKESAAPFSLEELEGYLLANAEQIRHGRAWLRSPQPSSGLPPTAVALYDDLEELERRLTALEEKMIALARSRQTDEELLGRAANSISSCDPIVAK